MSFTLDGLKHARRSTVVGAIFKINIDKALQVYDVTSIHAQLFASVFVQRVLFVGQLFLRRLVGLVAGAPGGGRSGFLEPQPPTSIDCSNWLA